VRSRNRPGGGVAQRQGWVMFTERGMDHFIGWISSSARDISSDGEPGRIRVLEAVKRTENSQPTIGLSSKNPNQQSPSKRTFIIVIKILTSTVENRIQHKSTMYLEQHHINLVLKGSKLAPLHRYNCLLRMRNNERGY